MIEIIPSNTVHRGTCFSFTTLHASVVSSPFLLAMESPESMAYTSLPTFWFQILDKSDYTVISGNPYIKKSGPCFYTRD